MIEDAQNELSTMRNSNTTQENDPVPHFCGSMWSVLLWSEQTKSHVGRGNSCLHKVFGLLRPSVLEADVVADGCPPCYSLLLHCLCCKCWQQFSSRKEIIWFTQVLQLPSQSLSCPWLNGALVKLQGKKINCFPLNQIDIVLWCEITKKMWFGEITVPCLVCIVHALQPSLTSSSQFHLNCNDFL